MENRPRLMNIHIADVVARTGARLAELVRWPRAPGLGRPNGRTSGAAAWVDPGEAAAWEAIVRESFRAGATLEAPTAPEAGQTASSSTSPSAPARPVSSAFALRGPVAARGVASVSAPTTPAAEPAQEPAAEVRPELPHLQQAGETAPEFLLRTPTRVTPVADDFFDGLIRRVEGDR